MAFQGRRREGDAPRAVNQPLTEKHVTRIHVTCIALLSTALLIPNTAFGQRRGELVEGLLRGFLEVKLEKERRKALERERVRERQRKRAAQTPKNSKLPPVVSDYRTQLRGFAAQSAALAQSMQRSVGRVRSCWCWACRALRPRLSRCNVRSVECEVYVHFWHRP